MVGDDPSAPTVESNRAAVVLVAYHVLDTAHGWAGTYYGTGLMVGPNAIISDDFGSRNHFPQVLKGITVQSISGLASGDWSGVPAVAVAHLDGAFGIDLLTTNSKLPEIKPVVFGEIPAGVKVEGYRFSSDDSVGWFNVREVVSVFVAVQADGQRCEVADRPSGDYDTDTGFDMQNRLACFDFVPAQKLERFLRDNGVPILSK